MVWKVGLTSGKKKYFAAAAAVFQKSYILFICYLLFVIYLLFVWKVSWTSGLKSRVDKWFEKSIFSLQQQQLFSKVFHLLFDIYLLFVNYLKSRADKWFEKLVSVCSSSSCSLLFICYLLFFIYICLKSRVDKWFEKQFSVCTSSSSCSVDLFICYFLFVIYLLFVIHLLFVWFKK